MSWEGKKNSKSIQGVPARFQGPSVPGDKDQPNKQSNH